MTRVEALAWYTRTEESKMKWTLDEVHSTSDDMLYYKGGVESGIYIHITNGRFIEGGFYECAVPHIGEAIFSPKCSVAFRDHEEAMEFVLDCIGKNSKYLKPFIVDSIAPPAKVVRPTPVLAPQTWLARFGKKEGES